MPARLYKHQIVQCDAPQIAMHLDLPNEYAREPFYAQSPGSLNNELLIIRTQDFPVNPSSSRNPQIEYLAIPPKLQFHGKLNRELPLLIGGVAH